MFEFIEQVVYINLDHRVDRRIEIEKELSQYFPIEKITRFSAIRHDHGGIGCTKSHIAVLEMAKEKGWKNYLVVEDDAIFSNFGKGYPLLEKLVSAPFDVITLGTVFAKYTQTYKLLSGQTTTSYIVQSHYYDTLLQNFREGLNGFLLTGNYPMYSIDQYWKRIQPNDNWFCVIPSLMIQRPGYSDIERHVIDNGRYFS
jgi:glycosyl transferase, family 25